MKKFIVIILCFFLTVPYLSGCEGNPANVSAPQENDAEESGNESQDAPESLNIEADDKFGGTLTIGTFADPDTLNPIMANDIAGDYVLCLIYPALMELDEKGNKVPYIIEEPEISADGLTIEIRLLDDLYWQDGTPITSADIDFTYTELYEKQLMWQWTYLEGATWTCPDDKTIVFTLEEPFPNFITAIGFWQKIVPKHIWKDLDIATYTNEQPVGFGPYKLTEFSRGQYYVLESVDKFPLVDHGRPYLDKVIFKPYPDVNTMIMALKARDIDITAKEIPHAAYEELSNDPDFVTDQNMSLGYEHLSFNLMDDLLKDVNVRTAISMCIDRKKIVDFVYDGDAVVMDCPISPVYEKYQLGINFPDYDVEGAKKLLEESGYKDTDGDGVLNAPDGKNLSFEIMYASSVTEYDKFSRVLVDMFKDIGLKLRPLALDKALYTDKHYNTHDFQMSLGTWGVIDDVESSMLNTYHSSVVLNWMQWKNDVADQAMVDMRKSVTDEDIMKNMKIFQTEFVRDIPDIMMVVKKCNYAYSNRFDGFTMIPSNMRGLISSLSISNAYMKK